MPANKRLNSYKTVSGKIIKGSFAVTNELFSQFHTDFLAHRSEFPASTYRACKTRSRCGARVATAVCQIPEVAQAGFTREQLRPDIDVWFDADKE